MVGGLASWITVGSHRVRLSPRPGVVGTLASWITAGSHRVRLFPRPGVAGGKRPNKFGIMRKYGVCQRLNATYSTGIRDASLVQTGFQLACLLPRSAVLAFDLRGAAQNERWAINLQLRPGNCMRSVGGSTQGD